MSRPHRRRGRGRGSGRSFTPTVEPPSGSAPTSWSPRPALITW